jgi:hypothetical protein
MKIILIVSVVVVLLLAVFKDQDGPKPVWREGEFPTMQMCLERLKSDSGSTLNVVTDTPFKVSGFLATGKHFSCQRIQSSAKGTSFKGSYEVGK